VTARLAEAVPAGALLLHVGPQKTGSTAIQDAMHLARDALAEHGVFYPGPGRRPIEAGWAVLGHGAPLGRPEPRIERWTELVEATRRTPLPRVCVSNEDLSRGNDAAVDRILRDLGPDRVHLVYVARRYDRLLPSHWAERLKARMTWSYADFLTHVLDDANRSSWEWRLMWESQSVAAVVDRWSRLVPRDRITVVALPEGDRGFLPRVFEDLLDLPRGLLAAPANADNRSDNRADNRADNRSYTFPEAEALRRVNRATADWTGGRYLRLVRRGLAVRWTNSPRDPADPPIPGLPGWALDRVAELADAQVDQIGAAGVRVVGDPEQLRVRGRVAPYHGPLELDAVRADLVARAVLDTIERMEDLATGLDAAGGRELTRELARRVRRRLGGR
jgi:hypothetical protein